MVSVCCLTLLNANVVLFLFIQFLQHQILHAGFGIAVMILTVGQILAGLLRPNPDGGNKRTIFNWVHRIFGAVTYVMAAITIFLGSRISYMSEVMKTTGTGLLAGMVVVHVLTAILMEILNCCFNKGNQLNTELGPAG